MAYHAATAIPFPAAFEQLEVRCHKGVVVLAVVEASLVGDVEVRHECQLDAGLRLEEGNCRRAFAARGHVVQQKLFEDAPERVMPRRMGGVGGRS